MLFPNVRLVILALGALVAPALAQPAPAPPRADDPVRVAQARNATIGLITGDFGSTDAQAAADLADVLDNGGTLRVLPILGVGSVQNIADLINLKGIDAAIVRADALTQTREVSAIPHEASVRYIAKLFNEEVHVLARKEITSLRDLAGKPVNIGPSGSGTEITAGILLDSLHISANLVRGSQTVALDQLRRGEIAAVFVVGGQPVPLLRNLGSNPWARFLPVPLTTQYVDTYVPTKLDPQSYPDLIPPGAPVDTVAVGALLLTMSTPTDTARAKRVNRFVDLLYERIDQLRQPGHHPKWQEVNLGAQITGFKRYQEAQALAGRTDPGRTDQATPDRAGADQASAASLRPGFDAYLQQLGQASAGMSDGQKEAMFRGFLRWRDRQRGP